MARNKGSEATISAARPMLVASAHTAWPADTPNAVAMPAARPPDIVERIVRAVSCPGVTITTSDTPTKATRSTGIGGVCLRVTRTSPSGDAGLIWRVHHDTSTRALPEEAAMSTQTETPARPTIEPTDRQASDLRDDPTQTRGSVIRVDRPSPGGTPPSAGPTIADVLEASPSDAELWFG